MLKVPPLLRYVGLLWAVALLTASLYILLHELHAHSYHEVVRSLEAIPTRGLLLAFALTLVSYGIQTTYDVLALRYAGQRIAYRRLVLPAFAGQALSNTMGFAPLTGAAPRLRLYAASGLSPIEITKVLAFVNLTFVLGFLALAGIALVLEPLPLPVRLGLPFASSKPLGAMFLGALLIYVILVLTLRGRRSPRIAEIEFPLPGLGITLVQILVSAVDCVLSAAVLYVLLPSFAALPWAHFLDIYLLALIPGLLSQVPGGLGVFEGAVMLLASDRVPVSSLAGALLANRVIYYLMPLVVAAAGFAVNELIMRREVLGKVTRALGRNAWFAPQALALTTFIGGAVLLFSGATPGVKERLTLLRPLIPLPLLELSHFSGSLIGASLLILARGLQRRLDIAYLVTVGMLVAGSVVSLLKGLDYEEATILAFMLAILIPCRRHFYRKSSLFAERFTPGWTLAVAAVIGSSVWLGLFAHKHIEYSNDLWWQFAAGKNLYGDASRFLRASVGASAIALLFAVAKLTRTASAPPETAQDPQRIRALVDVSPDSNAYLALLGDKAFLWSDQGNAFIMYAVQARCWVAMGDPVGLERELPDLIWSFREQCGRHEGLPVFFQVRTDHLPLYLELGLTVLKLGEEARVPLESFSLEGGGRKSLRQVHHRLANAGCTFEVITGDALAESLAELAVVSDAWLALKNTREKGFSLGRFDQHYLRQLPMAIVRQGEKIQAFANLWAGVAKEEATIDLMRHRPDAPAGAMDYLFVELLLWAKSNGYRWFNLGMAPLSGLEDRPHAPLWNRLAALAYRHGEHFYNFQGLRQYKEKFDPVWEPRYLVSPGGLALPRVFAGIGALTSGGVKGLLSK